MNSVTISLAALATFAGVYWLTPAPATAPQAKPEAVAASSAVAERPVSGLKPVAPRSRSGHRKARRRVMVASRAAVARPIRAAVPRKNVYFSGCNEVRAAGLAPLLRGQPGYRREMDGDDDGIACEPHRRR